MHRAAEADVESSSNPIQREELPTGFFPDPKTVELDVVLHDQFHLGGRPLIHRNTKVVFDRDDGFCAAFIVPRPVDFGGHPYRNDAVCILH